MPVPIHIYGKCRPGKLFGCKVPFLAHTLNNSIQLNIELDTESAILTISARPVRFPPGTLIYFTNVLTGPENKNIAMVHWRKLESAIIVTKDIQNAIKMGLFKTGQDYRELVRAFEKMGLLVVDIDWTA